MGRFLALDFGLKRTGIAVTDELKLIASGLTTVKTEELLTFLLSYCKSEDVERIVIGLPRRLHNVPSPLESSIQEFISVLNDELPEIPISRVDERFTSKMATKSMQQTVRSKKKRRDKALVDEISATIILQDYMRSN
ncbi:MAG: Holliday junction resolvase RuvX [Flavobacteriaceae bacterium]|nr:Holliday junction resolvase RuvX [Flavobacteriaceae bacterium]